MPVLHDWDAGFDVEALFEAALEAQFDEESRQAAAWANAAAAVGAGAGAPARDDADPSW